MATLPPPATATAAVGPSTAALPHRPLAHVKPIIKVAPFTSLATTLTILSPAAPAQAISKDQIVSSLTDLENVINGAVEYGAGAVEYLQKAFDTVRPGVEVAVPVVKQAASKALEFAAPIVTSASEQALNSLESLGIDATPALNAAKTVADVVQQAPKVVEDAKPIASATVETIASADPETIALAAGAGLISYLLLPPVASLIAYNIRGYKGDLTPAQALDLLYAQNYFLIDIRSEKEKSKAGVPRLPPSAKNKLISVPLEELPSKLKGLVRSSKKVEAEMAAIKISYLKKLNKGSNIVILDSYCDSAKTVAITLTNLGFKNTWTVADGFSGGRGWLKSRLGVDSYSFAFPEIVNLSRILPTTNAGRQASRVKTTSGRPVAIPGRPAQRLLPGSTD